MAKGYGGYEHEDEGMRESHEYEKKGAHGGKYGSGGGAGVTRTTGKHNMTDQQNAAKVAHRGEDKLIPTKKAGRVTRGQGKSHGTQYEDNAYETHGEDGTGFENGHMNEAMTDNPDGGPKHGPSLWKKHATGDVSQAIRRRAKAASSPY